MQIVTGHNPALDKYFSSEEFRTKQKENPKAKLFSKEDCESYQQTMLYLARSLRDLGHLDPAFYYATQNDFFPRHWGHLMDLREAKIRTKEWNTAVEKYIASSEDKRPADVIKKASMIGDSGGPLYVQCNVCRRYDKDIHIQFKYCGACKKKAYCSKECQQADWKEHKRECRMKDQQNLQLPSQVALQMAVDMYLKNLQK